MSSSSDNQFRPLKRLNRRKKRRVLYSTPVEDAAGPSSVSVSTIDACSSADNKRNKLSGITNRKQTRRTRKKKVDKRKLKEDSDSDWLTIHETTLNEKENVQPDKRTSFVLFSDYDSPERVREAHHSYHFPLESPVRQPRRWDVGYGSPEKIKDHEKSFITVDLPTFQTRIDDTSDEEESDWMFSKDAAKKYVNVNKRQKPKPKITIDKSRQCLIDHPIPTTSLADIFWDDVVAKHPEEMRRWVATSSAKQPTRKEETDSEDENDEEYHTKPLWPGLKIPGSISVTRGCFDRSQNKWIRKEIKKTDPYKFPAPQEEDFKRDIITGVSKMTLNEYLRRCRLQKQNEEQVNKEQKENRKKKERKRNYSLMIISSSDDELQIQREIQHKSEESDQESVIRVKRILQNTKNELYRNDTKRRKMAEESKPTIKSVEQFTGKRYRIKRMNS